MQEYLMLIDGEWCASISGETFDSINPYTGEVWANFPTANSTDVDLAVQAAYRAFHEGEWGRMTPTQRGHCLRRLGNLLAQNAESLGQIETQDTGKMFKETRWQGQYIAEYFHFYAGCADKIHGETLPIDKADMFVFTNREPLGVIAAIVPWNSQLFLSAVKIAPALAAGNTVVLKTSEHAPAAVLEFGKLIADAGIPAGVVNIISGFGEPCGRALTSHPLVSRISFTGGTQSAGHVIKNSAENFAEVSLELGGKSPFIVFEDSDIDSAANGSVAGIFGATGQSCVAGSRLIIHDSIADEFIEKMYHIAQNIVIGDPMAEETEMGPICTLGQINSMENQVKIAVESGAILHAGGHSMKIGKGQFFAPTIVECPDPDLPFVDIEHFGPVLTVLRFNTEEEAIKLANMSKFGLAAGIFTRDSARALRMSKAVQAGIVYVNTYRAISPIAEFGGMKQSGYGRESGFQAMFDYTHSKTVWMNTSSEPLGSMFVAR